MKRGCSGDDDGGRPPMRDSDRPDKRPYVGKGKGRARARTPPPESPSTPPDQPERVSDAYGPGRNPARVALEAFERGVRARAAVPDAPVAGTKRFTWRNPADGESGEVPVERRKTRSITVMVNATRGRMFHDALINMPAHFFSLVFEFVPFSRFLMFLCTSKFFRGLFPESVDINDPRKALWLVAFDCFKVSFNFMAATLACRHKGIVDFSKVWNSLRSSQSYKDRLLILKLFHQRYFGDILSLDGGPDYGRVRYSDFFTGKTCIKMSDFLRSWLVTSFLTNPNGLNNFVWRSTYWPVTVPRACLSTLRFSGIFSTFRTRRAFIRSLERLVSDCTELEYERFRIMLRFLIRLTRESFAFSIIPVNSREFFYTGRLNDFVRRQRSGIRVLDISHEDFVRLEEEFRNTYGENFRGMQFNLPPPPPPPP